MAKRINTLKAKQARQKKVAIALGIVFVLVLAWQGPKTLSKLKGPSVPASAAPGSVVPSAPVAPVASAAPGTATPAVTPGTVGAPSSQPAVLADTDTPIGPGDGQLLSFERFAGSDPFKQQVDLTPSAGTVDATAAKEAAKSDAAPPVEQPVAPPPKPAAKAAPSVVPIEKDPAPPAAETTISVNGGVQSVVEKTPFPADDPTFELVSLGKDGKSVEIAIAGGSISGGAETIRLVIGKPLTLQNTANGSRYELVLLTVRGAVPPAG
jgi:hypothetical protein